MQLRLPNKIGLTCLVFCFLVTAVVATPLVEYFTEMEIDEIRDTQDIGMRTSVFLDIAKTRLIYLGLEEEEK